jgi:hypothetical protein
MRFIGLSLLAMAIACADVGTDDTLDEDEFAVVGLLP